MPVYLSDKEIELIHAALGLFGSLSAQSSALPDYRETQLAAVFQQRAQDSAVLAARFADAMAAFNDWPIPKVTT